MDTDEKLHKQARRRIRERREFWQHAVAYVVVNAGLVGIWWITGAGYFWPAWVMIGWGIGLVFHALNTFWFWERPIGEDEIQREMERLRRRQSTGS
jgi:protein-S-isoprenylcysteine O-methyltransferase Ste14